MVPLSKQRNGSAGPSPPQPPPDELRRVDVDGFPEQDGDVFLFSQDVAKRSGDLAGAENPRGHLVQQGLKKVKIPPVQEGDANGLLREGPRRTEPPEPSADDDDMTAISPGLRHRHLHGSPGYAGLLVPLLLSNSGGPCGPFGGPPSSAPIRASAGSRAALCMWSKKFFWASRALVA